MIGCAALQEITSQPSRSPSMSSIYWDKNAVATLVDAKFSQTSYADNSVRTQTACPPSLRRGASLSCSRSALFLFPSPFLHRPILVSPLSCARTLPRAVPDLI